MIDKFSLCLHFFYWITAWKVVHVGLCGISVADSIFFKLVQMQIASLDHSDSAWASPVQIEFIFSCPSASETWTIQTQVLSKCGEKIHFMHECKEGRFSQWRLYLCALHEQRKELLVYKMAPIKRRVHRNNNLADDLGEKKWFHSWAEEGELEDTWKKYIVCTQGLCERYRW